MTKRVICTIIAKNYLAFARTLCRSFLELHPDGECYVLIIDEWHGFVDPSAECFKIVSLADLAIPDLPSFCFKYKIIEVSTAAKPFLLKYLMAKFSVDKILYLDPDVFVTNTLDGLYDTLTEHDILLTPHLDADYPEDDHYPSDYSIMLTGIFNLGFIGVRSSQNTFRFLDWWQKKLYTKCLHESPNGYFLDQKFLDYAQSLFAGFYIERHPGYNMAYWNIHSRSLTLCDRQRMCNGEPLYFFHFSGYSPASPDRISNFMSRQTLTDRPDLQPLFEEYRSRLYANSYDQSHGFPYTYGNFKSGKSITNGFRDYYRKMGDRAAVYGNPFESTELEKLYVKLFRFRWPLQKLYDYFEISHLQERVKLFK